MKDIFQVRNHKFDLSKLFCNIRGSCSLLSYLPTRAVQWHCFGPIGEHFSSMRPLHLLHSQMASDILHFCSTKMVSETHFLFVELHKKLQISDLILRSQLHTHPPRHAHTLTPTTQTHILTHTHSPTYPHTQRFPTVQLNPKQITQFHNQILLVIARVHRRIIRN